MGGLHRLPASAHESLAKVFDGLGFDVLDDPVFRALVIARIVEPTSLLEVNATLDLEQRHLSHRRSLVSPSA
jgi:hypothetical protein